MIGGKRRWHAHAIDVAAVTDANDRYGIPAGHVVLTVRLSVQRNTPVNQLGREIEVTLSRPMLELLCLLAEEVGAVYHVIPMESE